MAAASRLPGAKETRRERHVCVGFAFQIVNPGINAEFQDDKRFHPMVIGSILVIFMFGVAYFISYMESMDYFNSFYACFITYSTIGFGDIDIYVRLRRNSIPKITNLLVAVFSAG